MFDVKVVRPSGPAEGMSSTEGLAYCQFSVEMGDIVAFDQQLADWGAQGIQRPNDDIAEYEEWGEPHLVVRYWAFVSEDKLPDIEATAHSFEDRR